MPKRTTVPVVTSGMLRRRLGQKPARESAVLKGSPAGWKASGRHISSVRHIASAPAVSQFINIMCNFNRLYLHPVNAAREEGRKY
jgi:hypothetical protein